MCWGLTLALPKAGFRRGSRGPFVPEKGPKAISTQVGTLNRADADDGRTDQLATLKTRSAQALEERQPRWPTYSR
jgi:hypothetical protein